MHNRLARRRFLKLTAGCGMAATMEPLRLNNAPAVQAGDAGGLWLTAFSVDISPPLHQPVGIGFIEEYTEVEHPLLAKGVVLRDAEGVYVLCAVDYCGLCNSSYDLFRERIAEAAGTSVSQVAVQSVHQHTAPVFDANAARILYADKPERLETGLDAARTAACQIASAVREALGAWRRVTLVRSGKARVDRVASNRRIPQPDGTTLARLSCAAGDKRMREAPEGLIDPWLRTVTFYAEESPLARLHYYATHPQTISGGTVTYDVPGIARERLERESGIPQIYFTGCAGNVAMGKYNDGSPEARKSLAGRMYEGIQSASADCDANPAQSVNRIEWRTREIRFPLRAEAEFTLEAAKNIVADPETPFSERLRKAMLVAWIERVKADEPIELSAWTVGCIDVVYLPGEPFVQYQLAAQQAGRERVVCAAGYGDCAPWYIGEDRIYSDRGGYEQSWAFVGPCEGQLKQHIQELIPSRRRTSHQE